MQTRKRHASHPHAKAHLQEALALLWRALTDEQPVERRFRRCVSKRRYIEFRGRILEDESDVFWLMCEGDLYWLMSDARFPGRVQRFWEVDEIAPSDPGGWGT